MRHEKENSQKIFKRSKIIYYRLIKIYQQNIVFTVIKINLNLTMVIDENNFLFNR